VHVAERPQRFCGLEVGARMTVLTLGDGLLVHSPLALPAEQLEPLGPVRHVLAPNLLHHLHVGPWLDRGATSWCPAGLPDKRPDLAFDHVLTEPGEPFGPEVLALPLRSFAMTNEVVLLHRPSRTLVTTDLLFHFGADAPWLTRAAMWALGGYPGPATTLVERVGMRRAVAREELASLLDLDFDRLVMAHGEIIETGGKDALARAFRWLR
jgi:hypothetical protein